MIVLKNDGECFAFSAACVYYEHFYFLLFSCEHHACIWPAFRDIHVQSIQRSSCSSIAPLEFL
jgi:hypothetical protein